MKTSLFSTLAILATTALSLQAEAPRFGVQGLVNIPLGDFKTYIDSKPGPGVGVHGTFDLGEGHMLRPRLDYSVYPEATLNSLKREASSLSLGGDYLYFILGKPEGIYLTAGLSAIRWSMEMRDIPLVGNTSTTTTKMGLAAGVGYQWNDTVGTEVRYVQSSVSSTFDANTLQGGITIRF